MGINVTFNSTIHGRQNVSELLNDIVEGSEMLMSDILDCLQLACYQVVRDARSLPSPPVEQRNIPHQPNYIDDTGVLRSSIGFVIYDHGRLHFSNFAGKGGAQGKQIADEVAAKYKNDIVAVIVAGAQYAVSVERKGYDVITGSSENLMNNFRAKLQILKNATRK